MNTYKISWSKAYRIYGEVEVEADTLEEAVEKVDSELGNYEGSLQYCPEQNIISGEKICLTLK